MLECDEITGIIVNAAYRLHTRVGPGLLENVYEALLAGILIEHGLKVERQKAVSFTIDGLTSRTAFA